MGMRISNDDYGGWSLDIRAFKDKPETHLIYGKFLMAHNVE